MKATIYAEIPYEVDEGRYCQTPCPYRDTIIDGKKICVGSLLCYGCNYNEGINKMKKIVRCAHPDARN